MAILLCILAMLLWNSFHKKVKSVSPKRSLWLALTNRMERKWLYCLWAYILRGLANFCLLMIVIQESWEIRAQFPDSPSWQATNTQRPRRSANAGCPQMDERVPACSVAEFCATFHNPVDCDPPGSPVHGAFQAGILGWVAISSSRGSSWPRELTSISCIGRQFLYHWVTWEACHSRIFKNPRISH